MNIPIQHPARTTSLPDENLTAEALPLLMSVTVPFILVFLALGLFLWTTITNVWGYFLPLGILLASIVCANTMRRRGHVRRAAMILAYAYTLAPLLIGLFFGLPNNPWVFLSALGVLIAAILVSHQSAVSITWQAIVLLVVGLFFFSDSIAGSFGTVLALGLLLVGALCLGTLANQTVRGTIEWALDANSKSERREALLRQTQEDLQQAIYQRERLNIALQQANKDLDAARATAEEANDLKTKFLANMSHELRTPLNAIINFTRIIMSGMRGSVTEAQRDYLDRVRLSGEHLLGLINDILDLAKIEAGRMELFKEQLQLSELVRGVLATAIGLTKDKPIELSQDLAPDLPPIEADRTRIRQILLNLLSNAAKFTDQGTITVRVERMADMVVIRVSDTGIGIAPEHLATIFEEFRQVDDAGNRRYEGTGLGLAICRRLVELHGGRMWVESTLGIGSTFAFSLPIMPAPAPVAAEMSVLLASADPAGLPILVIDDDPAAIEIVAAYLGRDGYAVYGLTDSRQALDAARQIQPAALLLDVLMPHQDGWDVLAKLKATPDLGSLPVVLYSITDEQKLGFALGASAYLVKPVGEELLRHTVRELVARDARILVIDDDPHACEIVARQLEQGGEYRVMTAGGGQAGLDQIASSPPDLIILDLMMPAVDGFAVLVQLEREPRTRAIPVVVLTAKDLTREEQVVLDQRVRGLLTKGDTAPEQLLHQVKSVLGPAQVESVRIQQAM